MNGKPWSGAELDILRRIYPNDGIYGCLRILSQRSRRAIFMKCHKLGIHVDGRFWSRKEDSILATFYPTSGVVDVRCFLSHRSMKAIHKRAYVLGIKVRDFKKIRGLERNPNWCDGKSFEPYDRCFDDVLKSFVFIFFDESCLLCGIRGMVKFDTHHIDYVKKNNFFGNLVSLCARCHGKTNFNRGIWEVRLSWLRDDFIRRKGISFEELATSMSMSMSESLPRVNRSPSLVCSPRSVDNVGGLSQQVVKNG